MSVASLPDFTPPARQRWDSIPADIRQRLLSNVWCAHCRHEVIITNFTGAIKGGDLLLVCQSAGAFWWIVSQKRYIMDATKDLTMAHSTMLHVRVDDEIKTQASEALASMGLSVSDAVRILLKRVVSDQAFPLELKVPNAQTRAAIEEARAMVQARGARFDSADALIDDLEKAREQQAG